MKKIISLASAIAVLSPIVAADYGRMMDYGNSTGCAGEWGGRGVGHMIGGGILGLVLFILGAFIFSTVFWATFRWMAGCRCKDDKPKKR